MIARTALALGWLSLALGATAQTVPKAPPVPAADAGLGRFVRLLRVEGRLSAGADWQVWWALNKDRYIGLARREAPRTGDTGRKDGPTVPPTLRARLVRPDIELALRDRKTLVRRSAAYALGLLGDRASVPALTEALRDDNTEVQDNVILALGLLGRDASEETVPLLESLARGRKSAARLLGRNSVNDGRRALATLALGMTREPQAVRRLARIARGDRESRDVRAAGVVALGLLGGATSASVLVDIYRDKRAGIQIRALAVEALGRVGGSLARRVLLRAIEHDKTDVRRAAALALGEIAFESEAERALAVARTRRAGLADGAGPAAARLDAMIAELTKRAERETKTLVRERSLRIRRLRVAAWNDKEYAVRQFATLALGQVGTIDDRDLIADIFYRETLDVRPFAALALGILAGRGQDDGAVARFLAGALSAERRQDHRIAIALALGIGGSEIAAPAVRKQLADTSDPLSRSYYAIALGLLRDHEAIDGVLGALSDARDRDARILSVLGAGLLLRPESADRLAKTVRRSNDRLDREAAASALALHARSEDLRLLSGFIRDDRIPAATRAFVIEALGLAADGRDPSPIARLAGAHNYHLAFAAIDSAIRRKW